MSGNIKSSAAVKKALKKVACKETSALLKKFFKTDKGGYAENDIFIGVKVPVIRNVVATAELTLIEISDLLFSPVHEERIAALISLVSMFDKASDKDRKAIYTFYMSNLRFVNNWDLVDLSAPKISGMYLLDKDKSVLFKLAATELLWTRRVSIVSTFTFIKNGIFDVTLKLSEMLLSDKEDLMHKAVGWMLREVGKRDIRMLCAFLDRNISKIPRTALRYSIERFPQELRKHYLTI
ncbi:MAG: DNA alkylation repair protein [Candidatus Omnitrophica bacterium]|nr:DNA alkylation repair protein [Candidatus Omnitrophota bacterium]MDD5441684.1 DNA alkylation repair protein [Candidatus Omnitrophota bacterium]